MRGTGGRAAPIGLRGAPDLVRPAVRGLPPYRGLAGARPAVRLDGNENPLGPSPRVLTTLAGLDGEALSRYPDARRLARAWAGCLGVSPARLLVTAGSGPALALAAELTLEAGDACLLLAPSFELYGWAARRRAGRLVTVPSAPGRPFPARAVSAALRRERPRLVLLGLPDNPTGVAPSLSWLEWATRAHAGALFVVDEAYHEYYGRTALPLTARRRNLLITRTLSKAYGLAGARVGAVVGPARLIRALRTINVPYPVTGPAVAVALAGLRDRGHVARTVRAARRGSAQLAAGLGALGARVLRPRANFVLLDAGSAAAADRLVTALARRGIGVRDRSHLPGMAGLVRVTCGTDAENDRFLAVMRELTDTRRARRARRAP